MAQCSTCNTLGIKTVRLRRYKKKIVIIMLFETIAGFQRTHCYFLSASTPSILPMRGAGNLNSKMIGLNPVSSLLDTVLVDQSLSISNLDGVPIRVAFHQF